MVIQWSFDSKTINDNLMTAKPNDSAANDINDAKQMTINDSAANDY